MVHGPGGTSHANRPSGPKCLVRFTTRFTSSITGDGPACIGIFAFFFSPASCSIQVPGTASTATSFQKAGMPSARFGAFSGTVGSGSRSSKRVGPRTVLREQYRPMLACSGATHGPPAFQLLEVTKPISIPTRFASRMAWAIALIDCGPMKAGPAGTIFRGSRAPNSKM